MITDKELPVYKVNLPNPPIGNKIICLQRPGRFVLEDGPCTWRAMANTHQGTGAVSVYNGVPDESGNFPEAGKDLEEFNGRQVFNANPAILGMWMFDGGMSHGLTLEVKGVWNGVAPCLTITWMPEKKITRRIENV
jgi:hypothetical protein